MRDWTSSPRLLKVWWLVEGLPKPLPPREQVRSLSHIHGLHSQRNESRRGAPGVVLLPLADRESGAASKQEKAQGGRHQKKRRGAGKSRVAVTEGIPSKIRQLKGVHSFIKSYILSQQYSTSSAEIYRTSEMHYFTDDTSWHKESMESVE